MTRFSLNKRRRVLRTLVAGNRATVIVSTPTPVAGQVGDSVNFNFLPFLVKAGHRGH